MAYKFIIDQKLIVELNSGDVIEGEFLSSSSTRLALKNCTNTRTQTKDASVQYFYQSEIVNVKAFEVPKSEDQSVNSTESTVNINRIIKIPQEKYNALKELTKNYIYMATMDARYFAAVDALINAETVGTVMFSTELGRGAPIQLLVMSTWDQIYIFDISLFNSRQFPEELQDVLQCEDVVKVVHDSRELVDCMYHQYNIKVNNIFDTFVATQMISEENLSLPGCLSYYFNIPEALLKEATDVNLRPEWKKRPLEDHMKKYAAMNVQYLITLRNYLQRQLLKDFYANVDKHSQSTIEQSPVVALISLGCLDLTK